MIKSLTLKFGRGPHLSAERIDTTPVTVFVGPNNSGKSKVLTELYHYCISGSQNQSNVIVDRIEFSTLSPEVAEERIRRVTLAPNPNETVRPSSLIVGKSGSRLQVPQDELLQSIIDPDNNSEVFCEWYLSYNTLILDGQSRINLVRDQTAGDLQNTPMTSFQTLIRDNVKRAEIRRIIHDAFGSYLVIDPTNLGNLRLRLSSVAPSSEIQERGIHDDAVQFHSAALPIEHASDGVKAFSGIITQVIAGDPHILLIDEPEAFLHPALSFSLGKEIALASSGTDKRLFVSTHSPNFVMGCIQSGVPINIVRLTYRDNVATARLLPSKELLTLMRDPLLRSTNVLNGLFYELVVVTESDADRAFYQEINERLVMSRPEWGLPNCLFINAQNKQTVHRILKPLRHLGIPAAGIVDIDILKEGGTVWNSFLEGGFIPDLERSSLAVSRTSVYQKFKDTGKNMKREGGLAILENGDREAAQNLFDRLGEYGLFIVKNGELESWLPDLKGSGHGPLWLIDVFEKMGQDPDNDSYLKPGSDDVWAFVGDLKRWLTDANRKGIAT